MKKLIITLFVLVVSSSLLAQKKDTHQKVQIKITELGKVQDSVLTKDAKGNVKHIPQTSLFPKIQAGANITIDDNNIRKPVISVGNLTIQQINNLQSALDLKADLADVNSHILNTNNPHNVTKAQVGLYNVDNTSDANKPISTATQSALDTKINNSEKAAPNGVATLEVDGKIPMSQIPDALIGAVNYVGLWDANSNSPALVSPTDSSTKGQYYIVNVAGTQFGIAYKLGDYIISDGNTWGKVDNNNAVDNVFGRKGSVTALEGDYQSFYPRLSFSYNDPSWIASLDYGKLINTPTTLSGYGITDTYTKIESESRYVNVTGDTMTGDLTAPNFIGNGSQLTNVDAQTLDSKNSTDFIFNKNAISTNSTVTFDFEKGISFFGNTTGSTGYPNVLGKAIHFSEGQGNNSSSWNRDFTLWKWYGLDRWYLRSYGNNGVANTWREIWHSGNFTPSDYLNKTTGGTITGDVNFGTTVQQMSTVLYGKGDGAVSTFNYVDNYLNHRRGGAGTFNGWRWSFYNDPLLTINTNGVIEANNVTIAEIDAAGAKSLVTKEKLEDYVANNPESSLGYKVYSIIFNQTGTNNPVIQSTLKNTLGITPTFTRVGTGYYKLEATGAFTSNKTVVISSVSQGTSQGIFVKNYVSPSNSVDISTYNSYSNPLIPTDNSTAGGVFVEIRVYD